MSIAKTFNLQMFRKKHRRKPVRFTVVRIWYLLQMTHYNSTPVSHMNLSIVVYGNRFFFLLNSRIACVLRIYFVEKKQQRLFYLCAVHNFDVVFVIFLCCRHILRLTTSFCVSSALYLFIIIFYIFLAVLLISVFMHAFFSSVYVYFFLFFRLLFLLYVCLSFAASRRIRIYSR